MGQIGKPHGLGGDVYVVRLSDDPSRFDPGSELLHEDGRVLTVGSSRVHRDRFLVGFEGIDSRELAEGLRGALYVRASEARSLGPDEYWPSDLIGCRVVLSDGREAGVVTDVVDAPAQDLLVVETPAGERLIPMVRELVTRVDLDHQVVSIDPPEGLLDP